MEETAEVQAVLVLPAEGVMAEAEGVLVMVAVEAQVLAEQKVAAGVDNRRSG